MGIESERSILAVCENHLLTDTRGDGNLARQSSGCAGCSQSAREAHGCHARLLGAGGSRDSFARRHRVDRRQVPRDLSISANEEVGSVSPPCHRDRGALRKAETDPPCSGQLHLDLSRVIVKRLEGHGNRIAQSEVRRCSHRICGCSSCRQSSLGNTVSGKVDHAATCVVAVGIESERASRAVGPDYLLLGARRDRDLGVAGRSQGSREAQSCNTGVLRARSSGDSCSTRQHVHLGEVPQHLSVRAHHDV
mmetsp:Transcript_59814/g.126654  ORF Transcript_59814/g.126654 Transcript_59814/m.126654 type:complete len:250 (+) Transcript_59814:1274-2023(+)